MNPLEDAIVLLGPIRSEGTGATAQALAVTVTAVAPAAAGNVVAYAAGTPVPLASTLNFSAGQIVANTSVIAITAQLGDNFSIYNNSAGATPLVVDVVGYYQQNLAGDCTKSTQAQSLAPGATALVSSACAAWYTAVGGGCSASGPVSWTERRALANASGFSCGVVNGASTATITTDAMCCRRPGR